MSDKEKVSFAEPRSTAWLKVLACALLIVLVLQIMTTNTPFCKAGFVADPSLHTQYGLPENIQWPIFPTIKSVINPLQTSQPVPTGLFVPSYPTNVCVTNANDTDQNSCFGQECTEHNYVGPEVKTKVTLYYNPCCGTLKQFWQEWGAFRTEMDNSDFIDIDEVDIRTTGIQKDPKDLPMIVKEQNGQTFVYKGRLLSYHIADWVLNRR